MNAECQYCHEPVAFVMTNKGFKAFVHLSSGRTLCADLMKRPGDIDASAGGGYEDPGTNAHWHGNLRG